MSIAELVVSDRAVLGEGPVWHPAEQALYWLDIKGRTINRFDPATARRSSWTVPFRIASLAPRARGGFVAGSDRGFVAIDAAFTTFDTLCDPEAALPSNRFNDGKVDRAGRFWAGTMDDTEQQASGSLYRLDAEGTCVRVDGGYRVTNGPAFSLDGRIMYHSDSALQTIYRFDLDAGGAVSGKRVLATFGTDDGYPDGMTVDAEGCLWVSFWDGWCLRRLSPRGEVVRQVPLPVARPTSVAFGGAALDELYVTSATIGLGAAALAEQPAAGGLMRLDPGVRGVEPLPYAG